MDRSTTFNPLAMYMRQPKIYIKLPSNGEYWAPGALEMPDNGELAVYSMTAKDELLLNVPDALMNGQAIVDVVESCIPNIKNAWEVPSIDMDVILIAIRLSTYGEFMNTPVTFGGDVEMEYQADLRVILDDLRRQIKWDSAIAVSDELTVFVKPLIYRQMTETALQTFETQKIIQLANNDSISEDDKIKMFKESFKKLTESTIGVVSKSVYRIDSPHGSVSDPETIKEFIDNIDKNTFNKIQDHLNELRVNNSLKPMIVEVTDEMREKGVTGDTVEVPLTFDASTFFG